MAAAFRSLTSTTYASRTNTVLAAPSGLINDDILLAAVFIGASTTAPAITPPSGFTAIDTPTSRSDAGGFNGQLHVFWKRAISESGNYTFTHTTASSQAVLFAISGAITTGSPIDVYSKNSGDGGTATGLSITTTANDEMLVWLSHDWEGTGTLNPPSGFTERFDSLLYSATSTQTTAGATGNKTQTNANNTQGVWGSWLVAIKTATAPSEITGTLSQTLDSTSTTAAGTILVSSDISKTLDNITPSFATSVQISSTINSTLDNISSSLLVNVPITINLNNTLENLSSTLSTNIITTSSLSGVLDDITTSIIGNNLNSIILSTALESISPIILGTISLSSELNSNLEDVSALISGNQSSSVDVSALLDDTISSVTGTVSLTSSVFATLDSLTHISSATALISAATNTILNDISGTIDSTSIINTELIQLLESISLNGRGHNGDNTDPTHKKERRIWAFFFGGP